MNRRLRYAFALLGLVVLAILTYPTVMKLYYRVQFEEFIIAESRGQKLDPHLVAAVIFVESRFRAEAISGVGAIGLMQLMPDTAREISEKYDLGVVDKQSLRDPRANIKVGTAYLAELLRRFDEESDAIAAYNAGPTQVARWNENGVETIPFPETKNFVEQVTLHRSRLQKLYPEW